MDSIINSYNLSDILQFIEPPQYTQTISTIENQEKLTMENETKLFAENQKKLTIENDEKLTQQNANLHTIPDNICSQIDTLLGTIIDIDQKIKELAKFCQKMKKDKNDRQKILIKTMTDHQIGSIKKCGYTANLLNKKLYLLDPCSS